MTSLLVKGFPMEKIIAARRLLMTVNLEDRLGEILDIIEEAYRKKPWLLSGKSSAFLLSGLIYLVAWKNGARLTQREITETLGITEVRIRDSTRFWRDILEKSNTPS